MHRVYLAGPDVFLPLAWQRGAALKAICAEFGLEGVFPLDGEMPDGAADPVRIAAANEAHIRAADAVLANLTPFRGPSADAGTVYEIGYARALGRVVVGWSNVAIPYEARCVAGLPKAAGAWCDDDGLSIEHFGLVDNLMIACGVTGGGGTVFTRDVAAERRWSDLDALRDAAAHLGRLLSGAAEGR